MPHATITEFFRVVDTANRRALRDVFHRNVVGERPGCSPLRGLDALSDFYEHTRVIEPGTHVLEGVVAEGDHGESWGEFVGRTRDGASVRVRFADVYVFDGDKTIRRRSYFFRIAL